MARQRVGHWEAVDGRLPGGGENRVRVLEMMSRGQVRQPPPLRGHLFQLLQKANQRSWRLAGVVSSIQQEMTVGRTKIRTDDCPISNPSVGDKTERREMLTIFKLGSDLSWRGVVSTVGVVRGGS